MQLLERKRTQQTINTLQNPDYLDDIHSQSNKPSNYQNGRSSRFENKKWFNFFTRWFFLGIILILVSLILGELDTAQLPYCSMIQPIVSGLLSSVGIALLVGSVFDFSKNSEAFLQLITSVLSEIVVSKTFLETLSQKDKEQALRLILKPSDRQLEQYSNINAFFNKRIKESLTMFNINFKTNVVLDIRVYKDEKNGRIYAHTILTQTSYRIQERFEPIKLMLDKNNSKPLDVYALPPLGKACKLDGKKSTKKLGGVDYDVYVYDIPEEYQKYDHLTLKREWIEPGFDHWINYNWQSLTPYEGLTCFLHCESGLTIKHRLIFDNRAYYHVNLSDDKTRLEITSSQWLEADTGFSVIISDTEVKLTSESIEQN